MHKLFVLTLTNHVAWMPKVGVAIAKTDSPIGQSHQVNVLMEGDRGPVSLPDTIHPQSGDPAIWWHTNIQNNITCIIWVCVCLCVCVCVCVCVYLGACWGAGVWLCGWSWPWSSYGSSLNIQASGPTHTPAPATPLSPAVNQTTRQASVTLIKDRCVWLNGPLPALPWRQQPADCRRRPCQFGLLPRWRLVVCLVKNT